MNNINSLQDIARAIRNLIRTGIVTNIDTVEGALPCPDWRDANYLAELAHLSCRSLAGGDRHQFAIADREAYTGVTAKWLHTKDPKPQKQTVKLKRKPKVQHLCALEHPKAAKTTTKTKAKKEQEAHEGEYMAGESDNVLEFATIYATKAQAMCAAQAKWDKIQRGVAEFSISLAFGRAGLFPETPVAVKGFKRVIDEQAWIISRVVHNLNGNGYTTGLELEVSDVEYKIEELNQ